MNTLELLCETKDGRLIVLTINASEVIYHDAFTNFNPEKWKKTRDVHIQYSTPDQPTGGLQIIKRKEIIDERTRLPIHRGKKARLHDHDLERIMNMRKANWTMKEIAKEYNVSLATVSRFLQKHAD